MTPLTVALAASAALLAAAAAPCAAFAPPGPRIARTPPAAPAGEVAARRSPLPRRSSSSRSPPSPPRTPTRTRTAFVEAAATTTVARSSTWDDFSYDEDDDLLDSGVDSEFVAADENDDPSVKAATGMALEAPEVDWDGPVIDVPQGSQLELDEETVQGVLAACREEIGTMFGYQAENRGVGITGGVDFVELDGPTVVLSLKGRFWHQRPTVLQRVGAYLTARIPEIVDVVVANEYELTDEANDLAL